MSNKQCEYIESRAWQHYCGVLRPNFYAGCGWDDAEMRCADVWMKGRKSFPSGHSAHAFNFAVLLTLHLLRHHAISLAERRLAGIGGEGSSPWARQLAALAPGWLALFVACSRVVCCVCYEISPSFQSPSSVFVVFLARWTQSLRNDVLRSLVH